MCGSCRVSRATAHFTAKLPKVFRRNPGFFILAPNGTRPSNLTDATLRFQSPLPLPLPLDLDEREKRFIAD